MPDITFSIIYLLHLLLIDIESDYPETGFEMTAGARHFLSWATQITDLCPRWMAFGCQEEGTIAHMITNWMGDDAFVKKLAFVRYYPHLYGDLSFIRGKVVKKYIENGEHLVDIDAWNDDQAGVRSYTCKATVRLISRSA